MDNKPGTERIIEELRRRRAKASTVNVEAETMKIVVFSLCGSLYALPGPDVSEILPFIEIFPVPGAPAFIPGVINNRGDIESVINLNSFLGLPEGGSSSASRIIMVSKAGMRSGITADAVIDVTDQPVDAIRQPLSTFGPAMRELVTGELIYNNETAVMLDLGRLFAKLAAADE